MEADRAKEPARAPTRREVLRIMAVTGVGLAATGSVVAELVRRAQLHRVSVTRTQLGTRVQITVVHPDAAAARTLVDGAFAEIERLEAILSRHRTSTPVARLNRDGIITDAPTELLHVMERAIEYARLTDGAFDVTVAPLLNLYVSHYAQSGDVPSDEEVASKLALVNWKNVRLEGGTIALVRPGMAVTLDGIAKGYVVDCAVAMLDRGVDRVIVEAGGDIAATGGEDDPWQVAVQDPHDPRRALGVIQLRGESVASSGDYMQFFKADRSLHHILDPRTGLSPEETSATTVMAPTALDADAISTSVFVLGPEVGIALLDRMERVEGMVVTKTGEQHHSRGFES